MRIIQYRQIIQNLQKNMQNISPLFFSSKDQKSKISESESSINSRTCLGHLVLFTRALVDNRKRLTGLTPVFGNLKLKVESITRCADQWTSLYQHCSDIPGKIFPCTCVSVSCQ